MKKYIIVVCITILILFPYGVQAQQQEPQEKLTHDALLSTLLPHISRAVNSYYQEIKQFMDMKILDIKRIGELQYSFVVKMQLTTFEHAHNPPYGTDTITLKIEPSEVRVTNYEHKGDEWEQKIEIFKSDVLMDIQNTFNINLKSYQKYELDTLRYLSESQDGSLKSLIQLNEGIFKDKLTPDINPPEINVVAPFTFIKHNQGYIFFKKADGTNFVYTLRKENDTWQIIKKESKQGKIMPKKLLWYMVFKQTSKKNNDHFQR